MSDLPSSGMAAPGQDADDQPGCARGEQPMGQRLAPQQDSVSGVAPRPVVARKSHGEAEHWRLGVERYETLLRQSTEGIYRIELDPPISVDWPEEQQIDSLFETAYIAECNDAMAQMYGYATAEEMVGRRLADMLDRSDPQTMDFLGAAIRAGHQLVDAESHEVDREGRRKYFLNNFMGVVEGNRLVRVWGTQRDITERKHAEMSQRFLAELDMELRQLSDPDQILWSVVSAIGRHLRVSRCFFLEVDTSTGKMLVRRSWYRGTHSADGAYAIEGWTTPEFLRHIAAGGTAVVGDTAVDPRTAESYQEKYRPLEVRAYVAVPVLRCGRWVATLAVNAATPRRWQLHEIALLESAAARTWLAVENARLLVAEHSARVAAEQANKAKDQFLAVLSHELRTPLTPVLARAMLLLREPELPTAVRSGLETIRRNVELEATLISDLLDMTTIARGKLHLELETVDAHERLQSAMEVYQEDIAAKSLSMSVDLRATEHYIQADRSRIHQVFWNLVSNAVKYTPRGGSITVRTWNEQREGEEPALVVEVADTGVGIEPEVMKRMFCAFEQGEQTLSRRFGGLGLGLSICKSLVDMHGGRLTAQSAGRNNGATFRVELKTVPEPISFETTLPPVSAGRHPLRILLVEDNEDTLRVLGNFLRSCGHEVKTAETVRSALEPAASERFDVVICDIGLPDGNGWELMRALRARMPVEGIALSGFASDEDVQQSRNAGFAQHLAKPIDPERLEEIVQKVAGQRAQVAAGPTG